MFDGLDTGADADLLYGDTPLYDPFDRPDAKPASRSVSVTLRERDALEKV